jgi:NAD-dependent deacetylase
LDILHRLRNIIEDSDNIVFFGGAGVSTESNIPDFRSDKGIYNTKSKYPYPPEIMLSHTFFKDHTEEFFSFYRDKMIYKNAKPNKAHIALSKLEAMGKLKGIITQNIDGLHQMAGSKNVIELHGSIHRNYCIGCGKSYPLDYILNSKDKVPICSECGKVIKPDVVLYEESLDMANIENAVRLIKKADVLIIGGTSLVVYPAANMVNYYKNNKLVLINKEETSQDGRADLVIHSPIGEVLSQVVKL